MLTHILTDYKNGYTENTKPGLLYFYSDLQIAVNSYRSLQTFGPGQRFSALCSRLPRGYFLSCLKSPTHRDSYRNIYCKRYNLKRYGSFSAFDTFESVPYCPLLGNGRYYWVNVQYNAYVLITKLPNKIKVQKREVHLLASALSDSPMIERNIITNS